jgi:hypothetical protein
MIPSTALHQLPADPDPAAAAIRKLANPMAMRCSRRSSGMMRFTSQGLVFSLAFISPILAYF